MFKVGDTIRLWRFPSSRDVPDTESPYRRVLHPAVEPDYGRELWIGKITELTGNENLTFPSSYMVQWILPVQVLREYSGTGHPGFVTLYDRENV